MVYGVWIDVEKSNLKQFNIRQQHNVKKQNVKKLWVYYIRKYMSVNRF